MAGHYFGSGSRGTAFKNYHGPSTKTVADRPTHRGIPIGLRAMSLTVAAGKTTVTRHGLSHMALHEMAAAHAAGFDESKHPRDANGKWA